MTRRRLLLAFDGSCAACRRISRSVGLACRGKLEVVPLARPDIRELRVRGFGEDPPWKPTLLRVSGDEVRPWLGVRMVAPVLRAVGPVSALRAVHALGELRFPPARQLHARSGAGSAGRWLRDGVLPALRFGAGVVVALQLLVSGKPPRFLARERERAAAWTRQSAGHLPTTFDDVAAFPPAYRQAIYDVSPSGVKSRLWTESLRRHRRNCGPTLTEDQMAVLDKAIVLAAAVQLFEAESGAESSTRQELDRLRETAQAVYGPRDATYLLIRDIARARPRFEW